MKHITFIYGNQPFEIEEEVQRQLQSLLPDVNHDEAVFTFDIEDFFSKDQNQNRNLLDNLKNRCETVSFFSPVILIHLRNLQSLTAPKKTKDPLGDSLQNIVLVKQEDNSNFDWIDADTLTEPPHTQLRLTGKQLVTHSAKMDDGSISIVLSDSWKNRKVAIKRGDSYDTVSIKAFLRQKLDANLTFSEDSADHHRSGGAGTDDLFSLLRQYLISPPPGVKIVLTANIKNTREIQSEIFAIIKKNANVIRKTVAYDDFRPVQWVINRAGKKNITLNQESAELLIEFSGTDFAVLDMELEKLSILNQQSATVTPERLLKSVSQSKHFSIFRISDFMLRKDLKGALESINTFLMTQSSDLIGVFALIAAQFRRALKIAWMIQQDIAEKHIIEALGLNQWIAKQLIQHVGNFSTHELENIIVYLAKCDLQLKYSAKESKSIIENICFLICANEFQSRQVIKRHWVP